ncbi:MAG: CvpA family protein [Bacillota bacterium]
MNWLDAVLTVILASGVYRGLKTGFVLSCIRLTGIAAAFLIAARYHRAVSGFVENQWHLADILAAWLANFFKLPDAIVPVYTGNHSILLGTNLFQGTLFGMGPVHPGTAAGPEPLYAVARAIVNAGAFVLLFAGIERLWFFVGAHLTFPRRWVLFQPFDRAGGMLLGAFWGIIGGAVLLMVLMYVAGLLSYFEGPENFLTQGIKAASLVPYYEGFLRVVIGFLPGVSLKTFGLQGSSGS